MITVGDKEYRNLPEQVEENANNIARLFALFGGLGTIMRYCGSVATYADLPDPDDPDLQTGDVYNVIDTGSNYAWDGVAWDEFGTSVDLSNYPTLNGDNTFTGTNLFNNGVYFSTEQYEEEYIAVANSYFTFQTYMDDFLFKGGNLLSETGGGYSLGDSTHAWTDLYLSGKINPNSLFPACGLTLPSTAGLTADSELLDSASAQTISGSKTIEYNTPLYFYADSEHSQYRYGISSTTNYLLRVGRYSNNGLSLQTGYDFALNNFRPTNNNSNDLGTSSNQWKDGYFAGQVYAQNTINVIDAADIVSNTLTQDQYDLITNGKPTLIKGTLLGYNNPMLLPNNNYNGIDYGILYSGGRNSNIDTYYINPTTKVIALESSNNITLKTIDRINGKAIPAYPSNTGTFVLKCVDGVLTWVQE